ncbi:hypothetical protein ACWFRJ_39315 [Streptomyces sp. NPDC055239]
MRRTIAAWDDLLRRTLKATDPDPQRFQETAERLREEARTALYEALTDGLYIPAAVSSIHTYLDDPPPGPLDLAARTRHSRWVLDAFDAATEAVERAVTRAHAEGMSPDERDEEYQLAQYYVQEARVCRAQLSTTLMNHVEFVAEVTTIDMQRRPDNMTPIEVRATRREIEATWRGEREGQTGGGAGAPPS